MLGFWASFLFIAIAEMGDKTQLVALSFATKYNPWKVIGGVFTATLLVHLLSVFIGEQTSAFIPMNYLKILVGISFIVFGLWTLKGDKYDDGQAKKSRFGPFITVAIAFFLAELGDKTQLATISLAAKYHSFIGVWLGSTLGMVVADGIAIAAGVWLGKKLPEQTIRYVSAGLFILFGVLMLIGVV
jgi:putative Ca2+/H+ antiporter (TMEM165/GDT1 family)